LSKETSLFELATKLTNEHNIVVIPIHNDIQKRPALPSWTDRRDNYQLATEEELTSWFVNQGLRLAICLGDKDVCIDTDGVETTRIFWNITVPKYIQSPDLIQKLKNDTWCVNTLSGGHIIFQLAIEGSTDAIKKHNYGSLPLEHEILELITRPKYIVQAGQGYNPITGFKLTTFGKEEFGLVKTGLEKHEVIVNTITDIVTALKDQQLKENGFRHNTCLYLAGYLHKYGAPK
jgi:hypothetical protein